ncbi:SIR2 family protein [Oleiharenicola lentus]|uniref:SIR2 family protein n=1 Tax=Oleiharenicola lentus TaxID=2508720 RepID=UPI003F67FCE3
MNLEKPEFLRRYSAELANGSAALFVAAGLSIPAGFVDWRKLLAETARDLHLEIDLETDLLAVAQYEVNRKGNRDSLNQAIIQWFVREGILTENHRLLARLPVDTFWTTNYDRLLEQGLKEANRRTDVKATVASLALHPLGVDATVYKMHGDAHSPNDATLTKDDYECYELRHGAFVTTLLGHLLSKRFLFIGASFTDPNIEYTFNRLRRLLSPDLNRQGAMRDHYCMLRRPQENDVNSGLAIAERSRQHQTNLARFNHRVGDLKRYGIQTLVLDSYEEITTILQELHARTRQQNVLISGSSAHPDIRLQALAELLGRRLIEEDFNLVTGLGHGIGGPLLAGAHAALGNPSHKQAIARLKLFPFPYWHSASADRATLFEANRREMAAQSGASIILAGNKSDGAGRVEIADGVLAEFELAKENRHVVIPIGATGHAARKIWQEIEANPRQFLPHGCEEVLAILGNDSSTVTQLSDAVFVILRRLKEMTRSGQPILTNR